MRSSAIAGLSLAALVACLLLISLALGLSAIFVFRAVPHDSPASIYLQGAVKSEEHARKTEGKEELMEELVRPVKVWPLARRDEGDTDAAWQPTPQELRHRDTGHYRSMHSPIWDPHPRYEFKGLGHTFRLELRPSDSVTAPGIKVVHVWENISRVEEPKMNTRGCIYTGQVVGDPGSEVSLSLCHGMRGHIWTSHGSYTIEPAEKWKGPNDNMLHILKRMPTLYHSCHHGDEDHLALDMADSSELPPLPTPPRRTKRSTSHEYTIELLVVADPKLKDFHGDDLDHYIIYLISAVDKIFKNPSIGNAMSVVLVKILVLHERQEWFGYRSDKMLRSFCEFQYKMNDPDDSHPNHHDAAIFLTREKICRKTLTYPDTSCESIGLAEVGSICKNDNKNSCGLVKDMGLSTSFTIAHELGHVLSLPHDNFSKGSRCHRFMKNTENDLLMSSVFSSVTKPSWSNCSRHLLTAFLEEGHGWCLQDRPVKDLNIGHNVEKQLGESFGLNKQCQLAHGKEFVFCQRGDECEQLWCMNITSGICTTSHVPWADGTPCGNGKWCQNRQCVSREHLKPIDGGWSKWRRFGDCSRTCGGGVRMSIRECNNPTPANGGKYCLGMRTRYHSCNTTPECPTQDFREQQCAKFNNINFDVPGLSQNVKWLPKYDGISPEERCKLYCRNSEDNQHFELKEKVIDGTVCDPNTFDICVNGICIPAGCNHVLNSKKQLDYCGKCGGNNSTCKLITGAYNETHFSYRSVANIPSGASNLEVRQHGYLNSNHDNNFLALFNNKTDQYFLNGNYLVSGRKVILYGGTTLEYSGSDEPVEKIRSTRRPLTEDLNIQVCSHGTIYPPDITFEYTIPIEDLYQFNWKLADEWTSCDKVCYGETRQVYKCMRHGQEFSPQLCEEALYDEPPRRACNTHCSLMWKPIGRSECSSDCGPGYREIKFSCVIEENGEERSAQDEDCKNIPRPQDTEQCEGQCIEPKWFFSEWSECSKICGTGKQTRKAYCMDSYKKKRDDSECLLSEKKTEQFCNTQDCPTWQVRNWTDCTKSCGVGKRHREYWCQYEGKKALNELCPLPLPVITETCNVEPCPKWIEEEWSECSVSCGKGEKTRHVYCSVPNACSNNSKPTSSSTCYMPECNLGHANSISGDAINRFTWRQKSSDCSVTCGKGETYTTIECYDNNVEKVTDPRYCTGQYRPTHGKIETCYMPSCPHWVVRDWEPCPAICGSGTQSRRITCEIHNGQIQHESACDPHMKPPREERRCNVDCPQRSHEMNEWMKLPWSPCSVSCGTGIMVRKVMCHGHCSGPKPPESAPCEAGPCAEEGFWSPGAWSECSATCGEGTQELQFRCESREGEVLPDSYCSGPAPNRRKVCKPGPCKPFYKWEVTRWTPCSATCGKGERTRFVECKSSYGETVSSAYCLASRRQPNDTKACKKAPCLFDWDEGEWSQCSSSCGPGIQTRKVRCVKNYFNGKVRKDLLEVDERFCQSKPRPEHKKACKGFCNNGYKWQTGVWHPCNKPCNKRGKQKRNLYCYYGKKKVPLRYCPKELRPERRRKCETFQCPSCQALQEGFNIRKDGEHQLWLKGRNITIYCYNMQENNPREYISLPNDNYAEIFSRRIGHASNCSKRTLTPDHCERDWTKAPYGFTYFRKIHVNVTSLIVDTTDWTFATTLQGSPVEYGEAGDCHTRGLCPEGKFSINLRTTGFRVSSSTMWAGFGEQHAPPNIGIMENGQKVLGKCGGCCGFCKPRDGLKLDVLPP